MKKRRFFSAVVAGIMMLSLLAGNVAYAATDSGGDSGNAEQTSNDTGTQDTNDDSETVTYAADPQVAENTDSGSTIVQDDTVTTDDVASSIVMDDGSELTSLMSAPMMLGASAGQTVQLDYTHIISYVNDAGEGNGAHPLWNPGRKATIFPPSPRLLQAEALHRSVRDQQLLRKKRLPRHRGMIHPLRLGKRRVPDRLTPIRSS